MMLYIFRLFASNVNGKVSLNLFGFLVVVAFSSKGGVLLVFDVFSADRAERKRESYGCKEIEQKGRWNLR